MGHYQEEVLRKRGARGGGWCAALAPPVQFEISRGCAAEAEEEEAKRLQKKKVAAINPEEDFGEILSRTAKTGTAAPSKVAHASQFHAK